MNRHLLSVAAIAIAAAGSLDAAESQSEWKYLGQSKVVEDLYRTFSQEATGAHVYFVDTEESTVTPGLYRLRNPYADAPELEGFTRSIDGGDAWITVHAEDPAKVWFETFDTGLDYAGYGGDVKIENRAGYEISAGRMTLDEAAAAGYTGTLSSGPYGIHANWIKFEATNTDDVAPVYARTPQGSVPINTNGSTEMTTSVKRDDLNKAGFAIKLPVVNGWIDVISAETLGLEKGKTYTSIPGFAEENNSHITSPAAYAFKTSSGSVEETDGKLNVKVTDDGALQLNYLFSEIITTRRGGNVRRVTVYYNEANEAGMTAYDNSVDYNHNTSVIVGNSGNSLSGSRYPSSVELSGNDETNDRYFMIRPNNYGCVVNRIEIEWGFDESPWYTPKCLNLTDGMDINVTTAMACRSNPRYGMNGDGNEVWYTVNDGEAQKYDDANRPTFPWGRNVVKVFSRRHRRQDSEPLVLHLNVFSEPETVTDCIRWENLPKPEKYGKEQMTEAGAADYPSGAQYMLRYTLENTYARMYAGTSMNGSAAGLVTVKSGGGKILRMRTYIDLEASNKTNNGKDSSLSIRGQSKPIDTWPTYWQSYYGIEMLPGVEAFKWEDVIRPQVEEKGYAEFDFTGNIVNYPAFYLSRMSFCFTKIEFDWEVKDAFCERPMLSQADGSAFCSTTPVMLDCLTEGVTYHVKVNGVDTAYDPETGLLLPAGKDVTLEVQTTRDGSRDSEVVKAVYTVIPESVATLAEAKAAAHAEITVGVEAPLTVVYSNGSDVYLTDGTSAALATVSDQRQIAAGSVLTGVSVLLPAGDTRADIALESYTDAAGTAPVYAVTTVAEASGKPLYTPVRVERVEINSKPQAPGRYTVWQGDDHIDLVDRYDDVTVGCKSGKLYNLEGLMADGEMIAVMTREIAAEPVIAPADDEPLPGRTEMTITSIDTDARIYYTVNGGEETLYTAPVVLAPGEVAVTARAECAGMDNSLAVTAAYTVVPAKVDDLAALMQSGETEMPLEVEAALDVVYRNRHEVYLTDGSRTVRAIAKASEADNMEHLAPGCRLSGVQLSLVAGSPEPETRLWSVPSETAEGSVPVYTAMTLAEMADAMMFAPVSVSRVAVAEAEEADRYTLTDADQTEATLVNRYADASAWDAVEVEAREGRLYNVEGLAGANGMILTAITGVCATPVISPADGSKLEEGAMLTITCADADATIFFTVNGSEEAVYTAPVELPLGRVTVTARATCDGMADSDEASAVYNVEAGIAAVTAAIADGTAEVFDLQGRRVTAIAGSLTAGVYIVRTADGTTRRITIR